MYSITLRREDGAQTVQFGLNQERSFTDLADAFELVSEDIGEGTGLLSSVANPAWAALGLVNDTSLTLSLRRGKDDFTLYVKDAYSGSETSTGARTLAEVFDFATYWAMDSFE